jgi:hypothetical protein
MDMSAGIFGGRLLVGRQIRVSSVILGIVCLVLVGCEDGGLHPTTSAPGFATASSADSMEDELAWFLPVDFDQSGDYGYPYEFGPNFWPDTSTISLWRDGQDWILVHTRRKLDEDELFGPTGSWLSQVFRDQLQNPASGISGDAIGDEDTEGWLFSSESVSPELVDVFRSSLLEDPLPDVIDLSVEEAARLGIRVDPEAVELAKRFELVGRETITTESDPRMVVVSSVDARVGVESLGDPIPLDLIPIAGAKTSSANGYDLYTTDDSALVVQDGQIRAVVLGDDPTDRAAAAAGLNEVDDLRWGDWAWPQLADPVFLRVADLESDSSCDGQGEVIVLDVGCYDDVTPGGGVNWVGSQPSLAPDSDDGWTVTLPLERLELSPTAPSGVRVGLVYMNRVVVELDTDDLPTDVTTTTASRRDGLRLIKMLYPDQPLEPYSK